MRGPGTPPICPLNIARRCPKVDAWKLTCILFNGLTEVKKKYALQTMSKFQWNMQMYISNYISMHMYINIGIRIIIKKKRCMLIYWSHRSNGFGRFPSKNITTSSLHNCRTWQFISSTRLEAYLNKAPCRWAAENWKGTTVTGWDIEFWVLSGCN